ncbi:hypothetical protein CAEBREN_00343 [Caenorhabditis brenneri]|uniref:Seven TM Receptor n=1 Tax=Caenorhabditis brenneri TaxID=135651 RepID=G0N164_CAEBE|nr:hypothetical protein CAEBREN_00343 [Caenorhabditis brenneri]
MGSYKYLMIFMSAFEIVYGTIDLLIKPKVLTRGSYYTSVTTSERSILPLVIAYPLILLWAASFRIALALFAIHFLYRYFLVTGDKNYITGVKNFCLWMTIPLFSGIIYAIVIHNCFKFGTEMDQFARENISKTDGISKEDVIYFGFSLYKNPGLGEIDWMPIYGTIVMGVIVTLSFNMMIYFGIKGYLEIKKLTDLSTNSSSLSKTLQAQLFYSLVLQAAIPILLIHIPSTLIVVSTFFGTAHKFYGYLITVTIALFPAIDAMPSLIIVRPYREAIRGSWECLDVRMSDYFQIV